MQLEGLVDHSRSIIDRRIQIDLYSIRCELDGTSSDEV
jgi:hypothetical protein